MCGTFREYPENVTIIVNIYFVEFNKDSLYLREGFCIWLTALEPLNHLNFENDPRVL
jgi:hypothetical protein